MANYLVTGAAGGMGRAICRALTDAGDSVWGIDRAPFEEAPNLRALAADLTSEEELSRAIEAVAKEAGGLDGVIHAAGVYDLSSLVEMSEKDFLRDFNVNLFGAFRVNRLALPLLREKGRILIISSELAPLYPLPFTGGYAVTKGALEKYAEALRMEVQLLGYKVIVVRPGAVKTGMLPASQAALDRFVSETKLYDCSAARFKRIVDRVESRAVTPEKPASVVLRAMKCRRPRLTYKLNRNPALLLLDALPRRAQLAIIRAILKK